MFEIETLYGEIKINDNFLGKVKKWLDNNEDYIKQAYKQVIESNKYVYSKNHFK